MDLILDVNSQIYPVTLGKVSVTDTVTFKGVSSFKVSSLTNHKIYSIALWKRVFFI